MDRLTCLEECSDSTCSYECDIDFASCINSCPCQSGCPLGCEDCASMFCKCRDPNDSPEYIECKEMIISKLIILSLNSTVTII